MEILNDVLNAVLDALGMAGSMAWQIAWSLILGFALSAVIQAVLRRDVITRALGDARPSTLAKATGLGIASSSCSYAAVALARSLFRKGASFTAAIVFEVASTNLVIELGIIMALLLGWQFTLAEFVGGPVIIVLIALVFRLFVRTRLIGAARRQAEKGLAGSMEGHAAMDMSVGGEGSWWRRLRRPDGFTSVSHIYVMEWAAVARDIIGGLLIAGAVAAWVPDTVWRHLFAADDPVLAAIIGPLVGPIIAILSFVCSIGNVPLAAVLYSGGISFGGVISFMFADLIIIPILIIYRKYYGTRMTLVLLGAFYATMVIGGYLVEGIFQLLQLVPDNSSVQLVEQGIRWNYTTVLNILAFLLTAVLLIRFFRTGGRGMLAMMGGGPDDMSGHGDDGGHDHAAHGGQGDHEAHGDHGEAGDHEAHSDHGDAGDHEAHSDRGAHGDHRGRGTEDSGHQRTAAPLRPTKITAAPLRPTSSNTLALLRPISSTLAPLQAASSTLAPLRVSRTGLNQCG